MKTTLMKSKGNAESLIRVALLCTSISTAEAVIQMFETDSEFKWELISHRSPNVNISNILEGQPHIAIADLQHCKHCKKDCVRRLHSMIPDLATLMIGLNTETEDLVMNLANGVRGFIFSTVTASVLKSALLQIVKGYDAFPIEVSTKFIDFLRSVLKVPSIKQLTHREREVFPHLLKGCSNKEISSILSMPTETVRVHVKHIIRKFRAHKREQIANQLYTRLRKLTQK